MIPQANDLKSRRNELSTLATWSTGMVLFWEPSGITFKIVLGLEVFIKTPSKAMEAFK